VREIKFRSYIKKHQEFIFFDLYCVETNMEEGRIEICNVDISEIENEDQFIGLKDENGVEIYKSDLLRDGYGCIFEVVEDERQACSGYRIKLVKREKKNQKHLKIGRCFDFSSWYFPEIDLEIIGNIYENKELLNEN